MSDSVLTLLFPGASDPSADVERLRGWLHREGIASVHTFERFGESLHPPGVNAGRLAGDATLSPLRPNDAGLRVAAEPNLWWEGDDGPGGATCPHCSHLQSSEVFHRLVDEYADSGSLGRSRCERCHTRVPFDEWQLDPGRAFAQVLVRVVNWAADVTEETRLALEELVSSPCVVLRSRE